MSKIRYTPRRKTQRFKEETGLRIGVNRIQEQGRILEESLRTLKNEAKIERSDFVSGFARAKGTERDWKREATDIEQKIRTHKQDAIETRNRTDLARLETEIKIKGQEAEYWRQLTPKLAKAMQLGVEGTMRFADMIRGRIEWDRLKKAGILDKYTDLEANANFSIADPASKDVISLSKDDPELANQLQDKTFRVGSYWGRLKLLKYVSENKSLLRSDVLESFKAANGLEEYGEKNAEDVMDLGARLLLNELGVSDKSAVGKKIIEEYRSWGKADKYNFYKVRKVEETSERVKDLHEQYAAAVASNQPIEHQNLLFNQLVAAVKNGWHVSSNGSINDPTKGEVMTWTDAFIEAAKIDIDANAGNEGFDINERYKDFFTPITDKKSAIKSERWTVKHRDRFNDEVVGYYNQVAEKKLTQADEVALAADNKYALDLQLRVKEHQTNKTWNHETWLDEIEAIRNSKLTGNGKTNAYKVLGYDHTNFNDVQKWINFNIDINEGDVPGMQQIYRTATDKQKEILKPYMVSFEKIVAATGDYKEFKNQIKKDFDQFVSTQTGLKLSTSNSADRAKDFFAARVALRLRDKDVSYGDAYNAELELFKQGINEKKGPYAIMDGRNSTAGFGYKTVEFVNFTGDDEKYAIIARDYIEFGSPEARIDAEQRVTDAKAKMESLQETRSVLANLSILEINPEHLKNIAEFELLVDQPNKFTEDSAGDNLRAILNNARIISPNKINSAFESIKAKGFEITIEGQEDTLWIPGVNQRLELLDHPSVKQLSAIYNKTPREIVQQLFKERGYNVHLPLDESDKQKLVTNGNTNNRNNDGAAIIEESKNLGVTPMTHEVRYTIDEGLDTYDAFITANQLEAGWLGEQFSIGDTQKFFDLGGINYLQPNEIESIFPTFFLGITKESYPHPDHLTIKQRYNADKEAGRVPDYMTFEDYKNLNVHGTY